MTATAPTPIDVDDEMIFSAKSYNLNIPTLDGKKAVRLTFRLSGTADLGRTSEDDLAFLEAARMGRDIRVICRLDLQQGVYARQA